MAAAAAGVAPEAAGAVALRLRPHLRLRLRPRLHLGCGRGCTWGRAAAWAAPGAAAVAPAEVRRGCDPRRRLGLRPRLNLRLWLSRLRPGLDLGRRLDLWWRLGLDPRRYLGRRLRLPGGAAAGLSRWCSLPVAAAAPASTPGPGGQRRRRASAGPGSSRGGWRPGRTAGRNSPGLASNRRARRRVEPGPVGRNAGAHPVWSGARLDLARLAGDDGLSRPGSARRSGLSRLRRDAGFKLPRLYLPRSRMGRRRFERLRLRRLEPLLRRQLLDLLRHLGVRGMVALVGKRRARQAPARLESPQAGPGGSWR